MRPTKICLIGNSFSNGGSEKIHAVLSDFFYKNNIEIDNIIFENKISFRFSGNLLALKSSNNWWLSKLYLIHNLLVLNHFFKKHKFDFIIDFRSRGRYWQEFLYLKTFRKTPYIITVHSYNTNWYFPKNNFLATKIYKSAFGIVGVSKKIALKIETNLGYKNVVTIYNPVEISKIQKAINSDKIFDFEYVISGGRMVLDNNKQFDKLIEMYSKSVLPQQNIKLVLLGDGPQKPFLKEIAIQLNIADMVVFVGFQTNPFGYLNQAKCTLLCSKFEGFPNIIAESLACDTPVISFDCLSGPSEIIENQVNGILVIDQKFDEFQFALDQMFTSKKLYNKCKLNSKSSVSHLDIQNIGTQWLDYLQLKIN